MRRRDRDNSARVEELIRLCRRQGLPVTVQRRAVLETLLELGEHPTADEVYGRAARRLPGISRTTVYRVLEALVGLGVIAKASTPGAAVRYDPGTHRHHHLVCTRCDAVVDLDRPGLEIPRLPSTRRLGFLISDYSIHFTGLCANCRTRQSSRSVDVARSSGRLRRRDGRAS